MHMSGIAMFMAPNEVLLCVRARVWCLFGGSLYRESFSLFKQVNKLFFADQDIYWLAWG